MATAANVTAHARIVETIFYPPAIVVNEARNPTLLVAEFPLAFV
jgi:hypothetical protein